MQLNLPPDQKPQVHKAATQILNKPAFNPMKTISPLNPISAINPSRLTAPCPQSVQVIPLQPVKTDSKKNLSFPSFEEFLNCKADLLDRSKFI